MSFQAGALYRNRIIVTRITDIERITSATTNDFDHHIFAGAIDIEGVITFLGINHDFF